MTKKIEDESSPTEQSHLLEEIALQKEAEQLLRKQITDLMRTENLSLEKSFAYEIHELKQQAMAVHFKVQLLEGRYSRLYKHK